MSSGRGPVVLACALVVLKASGKCWLSGHVFKPEHLSLLLVPCHSRQPFCLDKLSLLRGKDVVVLHGSTTSPATCWDFKVQRQLDLRESGCRPPRRPVSQSGARASAWRFGFSLVTRLHCCPRTIPLHNPSAPGFEGNRNDDSQHPFHLPVHSSVFPFPT